MIFSLHQKKMDGQIRNFKAFMNWNKGHSGGKSPWLFFVTENLKPFCTFKKIVGAAVFEKHSQSFE